MRYVLGACLVLMAAFGARAQTAPATSDLGRIAPVPGDADAIMYYRPNDVHVTNGLTTPESVTIMVAHLTEQGIETQELFTNPRAPNSLTPSLGPLLYVAGGKLYFNNGGRLNCFDISTSKVVGLGVAIAPFVQDGKIYYSEEQYSGHLSALDPASQTAEYMVTWKGEPSANAIRHLVPSPDCKRVAWIALPNANTGAVVNGWRIGVFDLESHTNTMLVAKLPYTPPPIRTLSSPNLIAWRDDKTLLTVTNDPSPNRGTPAAGDFLTAVDIATGKLTRLCPIPTTGGEQIQPPTPNTDLMVLAGGPFGVPLVFESGPPALKEARMRYGVFELDAQRNLLLNDEKIPIDPFYLHLDVQLSPDGKRLLYVRNSAAARGSAELHLYDGPTKSDRVVGVTSMGMSPDWFHYRNLSVPRVAPSPPIGFVGLDELQRSAMTLPAAPVRQMGEPAAPK